MTPERFTDWLQGAVETMEGPPTATQWAIIKDHLALCFDKVTPNRQAGEEAPGGSASIEPLLAFIREEAVRQAEDGFKPVYSHNRVRVRRGGFETLRLC